MTGNGIERFLNILRKRNIIATDIKIIKDYCILKIAIKDFFSIRDIVKKTRVKVKIQRKAGFPFLFSNFKKRRMFIGGLAFIFCSIYIMSLFIWKVEVIGYGNIDKEKVLNKLDIIGIRAGTGKNKIDNDKVAEILIKELDDVSWAFSKFEGYTLKVFVAGRKKIPEIIQINMPSNIVAKKDGVIKKIVAKSGFAKVKEGDVVRKGDVLITGEIEFKDGKKKAAYSIGEVYARTWYTKKELIETTIFEKIKTGKVINRYYCNFDKKRIYFSNNDDHIKNYDKIDLELTGGIFNKIGLPIGFGRSEFYENKLVKRHVERDIAVNIARDKAREGAKLNIPKEARIVSEEELFNYEGNNEFIELIIECLEEIGENELIGGTTIEQQ